MPLLVAGSETLFIINDTFADASLGKQMQTLLVSAIIGRHHKHYLSLLMQSYVDTPKDLTGKAKVIFTWYPDDRENMDTIQIERSVLTNDELIIFMCLHHTILVCILNKRITMDLRY